MLTPPSIDLFSLICLAVMAGVSLELHRKTVPAPMHAATLVALGVVSIGASIIYNTATLSGLAVDGMANQIDAFAGTAPLLITSITVPLLLLAILGPWQAMTQNWRGAPQRSTWYILHWTLLVGWLVVALMDPATLFANTPPLAEQSPEDRRDLMANLSKARQTYMIAILLYAIATTGVFLLPVVARWVNPWHSRTP
ncbi:hypothetical protein KUV51_08430 [Tateyamaria omphalii]|uniref:hypothetical protein n=1 Tax=Tateyamaria omphalii TaxID=299262 RepID=UPI001C990E2E|nr:hypothetical protein [Tateyamaria omphalii]MBY5933020.1 hypothetical protein [Tateyamaria omphalii]